MHSLYFLKSVSLVIIGNTLRIIIFIVGSRANNAISTYTRVHLLRIITAHNWPHDVKIFRINYRRLRASSVLHFARRYEYTEKRANRWAGCASAHPVSPHLIKLARYTAEYSIMDKLV